jgi:hypothetical protein
MIAEPYICLEGPKPESVEWFEQKLPEEGPITQVWKSEDGSTWVLYADFERSKLEVNKLNRSWLYFMEEWLDSEDGICQNNVESTEHTRLLSRVAFLKQICEQKGVPWLTVA